MININSYILEKLKINKYSKVNKFSISNISLLIEKYLTKEYENNNIRSYYIRYDEKDNTVTVYFVDLPKGVKPMEIAKKLGDYLEEELDTKIYNTNDPNNNPMCKTWSNIDDSITFIINKKYA